MGRNPRRASSMKAMQAIRENSQSGRAKRQPKTSENAQLPTQPGVKRSSSPNSIAPPNAKRNALGDVTNNRALQQGTGAGAGATKPVKTVTISATATVSEKQSSSCVDRMPPLSEMTQVDLDQSVEASQTSSSLTSEETPVTAVQNFLQATTLSDDSLRSEESLDASPHPLTPPSSLPSSPCQQPWRDIDQAEAHDPLFSAEYAPEIYQYMRRREEHFSLSSYMERQPDITASMRTILVDWLIEVQENFELFHETLYLAVRLADLYLSQREVKREYLQLVGATAMLISAKFEELSPPLVDDFLYLCDDAYTHDELLRMERDILKTLGYDINIPVAYRFIRRLARAAEANMETHTLARYISESTLQEYQFVDVRPSHMAAASMYLALRMRKLGGWTPTLQHYSGYTVEQLLPLVERLNALLQSPLGNTTTVRSKYSHEVFFKVALTAPLKNVKEDAGQTLLECPSVNV